MTSDSPAEDLREGQTPSSVPPSERAPWAPGVRPVPGLWQQGDLRGREGYSRWGWRPGAARARSSGVQLPVLDDVRALAEGLPALPALVRPLPCVNPLVLDEVGLLAEGLLALGALVRPGPGVDPAVLVERGAVAEGAAALAALVRPLAGVNAQVLHELALVAE